MNRGEGVADPVYGVVLAAGQSRRFGGGKLAAPFRGRPLLAPVLEVVSAARESGVLQGAHVVVAADDLRTLQLVEGAGLDPVLNNAPHLGLSHSLQLALAAVESRAPGKRGALMVLLGDQPLVRLEVITALREAWESNRGDVIRPAYQASPDVPGHPVLLDRSVWPLLYRIQGDRGFAGGIDGSLVPSVLLPVLGRNPDVDTPLDLRKLEESEGSALPFSRHDTA